MNKEQKKQDTSEINHLQETFKGLNEEKKDKNPGRV